MNFAHKDYSKYAEPPPAGRERYFVMNKYENKSRAELSDELEDVRAQLAAWKAKGIDLDITRGKPGRITDNVRRGKPPGKCNRNRPPPSGGKDGKAR